MSGHLPTFEIVPLVIASILTMAIVFGCMAVCLRALNGHVRKKEAEAGGEGPSDPYRSFEREQRSPPEAIVYYVLSALFWPAAFAFGAHFLRDRATVRVGRACIMIGMGIIAVTTVLTCVGIVVFALVVGRTPEETADAPPPPPPPTQPVVRPPPPSERVVMGKAGTPVRVNDVLIEVHAVDRAYAPVRKAGDDAKLVAIDISFRNEGAQVLTVGSYQMHLFDGDGYQATSYYAAAKKPALGTVKVTPGNVARGWVTFQLATEGPPKRVQVRVGTATAEIDLGE
jgi:hypothetical protein